MTTAMRTHRVGPIETGSGRTGTLDAIGAIVAIIETEIETGIVASAAATTDAMTMTDTAAGGILKIVAEVAEINKMMPSADTVVTADAARHRLLRSGNQHQTLPTSFPSLSASDV
jgi:hypothetical protein